MQRINSVNARPDANGKDKVGFHDNTDLQGQDATYLTPAWCNQVQEELANAIEAFTSLNGEKDQLAKILSAMNKKIQEIDTRVIEDIGVGDLFLTRTNFADNNAVFKHKGYGEWERVGNGHALITQGLDDSRPDWMRTIGNTGGSDTHTLSINELPKHRFKVRATQGDTQQSTEDWDYMGAGNGHANDEITDSWGYMKTNELGNDQPHNNIQLSYVVGVWLRIN